MRIVDYSATPHTLSWFRAAGIPIAPFLRLRRIPSFAMRGKGAVPRVDTPAIFWLLRPIPTYNPDFAQSFSRVANDTATALLAEGKLLRLAWSGGLDSTAALLALKNVGATKAQVEVYYTDASVAEYPALVPFVEQNFTALKMPYVEPVVSADSLWVNGEGGNQIFFPVSQSKFNAMRTKFSPPANELPWEEFYFQTHPDWYKSRLNGFDRAHLIGDAEKQAARNLMSQCPFPVVTVEQAQWWRIFVLHWQNIYYRQGHSLAQTDFMQFATSVRPFFMTAQWQRWSMKRMSSNLPDTSYLMLKKPMKDYINSVYPDADYYNTKVTTASSMGAPASLRPYVRFEDGSAAVSEADCVAKVAA